MTSSQNRYSKNIAFSEYQNILNILYLFKMLDLQSASTTVSSFFTKFMQNQIIDYLDNKSGGDTTLI